MKTLHIFGTQNLTLTLILTAALGVGVGFTSPASAQSFPRTSVIVNPDGKVTYLGTLGGDSTWAYDINDAGQIVGKSTTAEGSYHAFITGPNGQGMTDLGTLGGSSSVAYAINAAGRVVGASGIGGDDYWNRHAFITGPNGVGMTDLGIPGLKSEAHGINDSGQVVGYVYPEGKSEGAFITGPNGEGITYLDALPRQTSSRAVDINNVGQVVGTSYGESESGPYGRYVHAFITGPNGMGIKDLGVGGHAGSTGAGINNAGQAVGRLFHSSQGGGPYASGFVTGPNGEDMTRLTVDRDRWTGTEATDINNAGQVVGDFYRAPNYTNLFFSSVFIAGTDDEGITHNLIADIPSGFYLYGAEGINNLGQVIAHISPIPEPASYALFLAGLGLAGFIAQRKKPTDKKKRRRNGALSVCSNSSKSSGFQSRLGNCPYAPVV